MSEKEKAVKNDFIKIINKPMQCTEIKILLNGKYSRATIYRHLKKLLKTGDVIFITEKTKHPKKFPTKKYLKNNLKSAKKINKFKKY